VAATNYFFAGAGAGAGAAFLSDFGFRFSLFFGLLSPMAVIPLSLPKSWNME
jgi:hypothetical protein